MIGVGEIHTVILNFTKRTEMPVSVKPPLDLRSMALAWENIPKLEYPYAVQYIPSPSGKAKWYKRSVENILDNEKYCGNVIVVKTYEISTPEKKRVHNRSERKKYYAVGSHLAIITQEQFDLIQAERKTRTNVEMTESGTKRKSTRYSSE